MSPFELVAYASPLLIILGIAGFLWDTRGSKKVVSAPNRSVVKEHLRRVPNKINLTDDEIAQMAALKAGGLTTREIGRRFGCSHVTVIRRLQGAKQ